MKIAKKLLAIFLVALMLITAVPVTDTGWFENVEAHAASITIENNKTDFIQYADRIKISVVGGAKGNWVGVFPSTAGDSGYIAWSYWETGDAKYYDFAGNDNEYLTGINTDYYITGDNGYRYLKKGTYNFRFFNSSGTKLVTSSNFTVYDYPKTTKQSYSCNETITVKCSSGMYTGNPGHAAVRIYDVGTYDNGSISSNNYKYSARIGGQDQTKTITNPGPGNYYVVFFKFDNDYSYDHVGSKYKFTVTGHSWNSPTYSWGTDGKSCTATRTCKNNSAHKETSTATISSSVQTAANCTTKGTTKYTATFGVSWATTQTTTRQDIAKNSTHNFSTNKITTAATCTKTGVRTYYCSRDNAHTKTETVPINSTAHSWNTATYTWAADYSSCTAKRTCKHNSAHTESVNATITSATTNATCTAAGNTKYTATFPSNGWTATQTKNVAITALGHEWDEGVVNPAPTCTEDGVKTYTCSVCGETKKEAVTAKGHTPAEAVEENRVEATCTVNGSYDEVVYCSVCNAEISRTPKTITAPGHAYADTTYSWSADGKSCTATRVCERAEGEGTCGHTETADAEVNGVATKAPTCTENGETTYTATFNVSWAETKTKTVADIAALDHDWDTVTYNFAEDGKSCTATRVCKRVFGETPCGETETAVAEISKEEKTPATCKDKGWTTYTATFSKTWAETKSLDVEDIPALDHNFATEFTVDVKATCEADGSKSKHCSRCSEVTEVTEIPARGHNFVDATGEGAVKTPATCLTDGEMNTVCSNNTATDEYEACEATSTRVILATGHDFGDSAIANEATCIATGNVAYKSCKNCGLFFSADADEKAKNGAEDETSFITPIDEDNHVRKTTHAQQDATCTDIGYKAGVYCNACGTWISGHEEIPANGHTWEADGKFTKYKTPNGDYIGKYTYECTVDGCNGILEIEVKAADTEALDKVIEDLQDILDNNSNLTDDTKKDIKDAIDSANDLKEKDPTKSETKEDVKTPDGQTEVDNKVTELENLKETVEDGIKDGTLVYVDFSAYKAALKTYEEIANKVTVKEADKNAVQTAIDSISGITETSTKANGNQEKVTKAASDIAAINAKYEGCASGSHDYDSVVTKPTCTTDGYTTKTCKVCGDTAVVDPVTATGHKDVNFDHECDNGCGIFQGVCEDNDKDHACDYGCDKVYGVCEDNDKDHDCDYGCDKYFGTHEDEDPVDHVCDYGCKVTIGTCEDKDLDHKCDHGCDKVYGEHKDSADDNDHVCDYCKSEEVLEVCKDAVGDKNHSCDICGKADITAHTYGEWVLTTAPTAGADGEYTKTCSECEDKVTKAVKLADYTELEEVKKALEDIKKNNSNLTDASKEAIDKAIEKANGVPGDLPADVVEDEEVVIPGKQGEIDSVVNELNIKLEEINNSVNDGTGLKADYTDYNEIREKLEALKETDALKSEYADKIQTALDNNIVAEGLTKDKQDVIDTAYNNLKSVYDEVKGAIDDKTALDADYTDLNEAIAKLEAAKNTEGLTDAAKERLDKAIEDAQKVVNQDLSQSDADTAILNKAVEDANKAAVITGADLKADYSALNEAIAKLEEAKKTEGLTTEAVERLNDALEEATATLASGSLTQSAEDTEILNKAVDDANKAAMLTDKDFKADYAEYNSVVAELNELKATPSLKAEYVAKIEKALQDNTVAAGLTKDQQGVIEEAVANLKAVRDDVSKAIADGSALDADDSALKDVIDDLKDVITNNPDLTDEAKKDIQEAIDNAQDVVDEDLSQSDEDLKKLEDATNAAQDALDDAKAGIADGSALKADYTDLDKAIANLEEAKKTAGLTDAAVERLEKALEAAKAVDRNLTQSDADKKTIADAAKAANEAAVLTNEDYKVNKDAFNNAVAAFNALGDIVTNADKETVKNLVSEIGSIPEGGSKAQYQNTVDTAAATVTNIVAKYKECAAGNHRDENKDHACDYGCTTYQGKHEDSADDKDHVCDYGCGATLESCSDIAGDNDHSCDVCGTADVTAHSYKAVVTAPTCTTDGYTTHTCEECGDSYTDTPVTALGHKDGEAVVENDVKPTCTDDGSYDTVTYCTVCKEETSRKTTVVTALGHKDGEAVVENDVKPTCTDDGSYDTVTYCTVCKEETSRKTTVVTALGHKDGEAVVENDVKPTCTDDGSYDTVTYCTVCKEETSRKTTVVTALGHKEIKHDAKAPDCDDYGWDAYVTCSRCDYTTYKEIPATGHTEVVDKAVSATCTETGLTEGKHCSVCKEVLVKQTVVPAMGHSEVILEAKKATCTETGLTEGKKCSVCKEVLVEQTVIKMLPHTPEYVPGRAPTCSQVGLTAGEKCSVCSTVIVKQNTIEKLPHTEEIIPGREPTCTLVGYKEGKQCSVCKEVIVPREKLDKLPHDFKIAVTNATCEEDGYKTRTCSMCLVSEVVEVYRATGHNFQNGKCTNCGSNNVHNCSHMCHKEGFFGFIWMIVNFFYRFFNLQQYCDCGLRHYEKPIIAWPW